MRRRIAAVTVALAALMVGAALASATGSTALPLPTSDPFYTYTGRTPLSQITPGTVLKERAVSLVIGNVPRPFTAAQVLYRTEGELGQPTVTVATVIKPLVSTGATKLVSYQTFYDALGAECDPSYTLRGGNSSYSDAQLDGTLLEDYLAAGDTVVTSDYEGENLDWTAGYESGYDTLDGIRAAEHLLSAPATTPVGIVGYSGGSIATEWASELAPKYAPELNIVGAAEGGVPVDFAHNLTYINGSPDWSGIIPGTLVALTRAFGINLRPYLSAYGKKLASQASDACINSLYGAHPGLTVKQLVQPEYANVLNIPAFTTVVNKLIMGSAPGHPTEPLLMGVGNADGTGDGVMISGDVEALAHEYCRQGVNVTFSIYKGQAHTNAAVPFEANAVTFLTSVLNGVPVTNGCSSIGAGNSLAPLPVPCNFARGSIHGHVLGPVTLGLTRGGVRRLHQRVATHGSTQTLCLQPASLQLAYPSTRLLQTMPQQKRAALRRRVVAISTANTVYAIRGVRAGSTATLAAAKLHLTPAFTVAGGLWYLVPSGSRLIVLEVRQGAVSRIGIAARWLGRSRAAELALLHTIA